MKKKLAVLLVVTMVLVLGVAQVASAGWGGGMFGMWGGSPPQLSADNWQSPATFLGLTDEQSEQLKKIQQDTYNSTQDLRTKLQKAMFELRQMGWEKNPDQSKLDAAISEVNNLRSQMYDQAQKNRNQMTSTLTQEQLAKIGQQGFGRGMGMGMGMGHRGGMRGYQQGTAQ